MSAKAILWISVGVLLTVFVFQNTVTVEVGFLFWTVRMSRVLLLGGAVLLGFLAGFAAGWEYFVKKKRSAVKETSVNSK